MQFQFGDESETVIVVTLAEGESVGRIVGPMVTFVPADPMNSDYAAIIASGEPIGEPVTQGG
jgi:hypothetical protein